MFIFVDPKIVKEIRIFLIHFLQIYLFAIYIYKYLICFLKKKKWLCFRNLSLHMSMLWTMSIGFQVDMYVSKKLVPIFSITSSMEKNIGYIICKPYSNASVSVVKLGMSLCDVTFAVIVVFITTHIVRYNHVLLNYVYIWKFLMFYVFYEKFLNVASSRWLWSLKSYALFW